MNKCFFFFFSGLNCRGLPKSLNIYRIDRVQLQTWLESSGKAEKNHRARGAASRRPFKIWVKSDVYSNSCLKFTVVAFSLHIHSDKVRRAPDSLVRPTGLELRQWLLLLQEVTGLQESLLAASFLSATLVSAEKHTRVQRCNDRRTTLETVSDCQGCLFWPPKINLSESWQQCRSSSAGCLMPPMRDKSPWGRLEGNTGCKWLKQCYTLGSVPSLVTRQPLLGAELYWINMMRLGFIGQLRWTIGSLAPAMHQYRSALTVSCAFPVTSFAPAVLLTGRLSGSLSLQHFLII